MRKLAYVVSGGISQRRVEQCPIAAPHLLVQEACEYAFNALGIPFCRAADLIDGVIAPHVDPLSCNPYTATMLMEHLGLSCKRLIHVKKYDAMGGVCFQEAVKQVESDDIGMDICLVYGWEMLTDGSTTNEKIKLLERLAHTNGNANTALPPINTPNATAEQIAKVSVKNHRNAAHNPYACRREMIDIGNGEKISAEELTVNHILNNTLTIARPSTRLYTCDISERAAVCIIANENGLSRLRKAGAKLHHPVRVSGMGQANNGSRSSCDHTIYDSAPATSDMYIPNPTQTAAYQAYTAAKVTYPFWELDFIELHDSRAPYEIQTYEDLGLCDKGKGGAFVDNGYPFLPSVNYGKALKEFMKRRVLAVNPSGGLIACGHSGSATALRQIIFGLWQIQGTIKDHFGSNILQVPHARRGAIHSCNETNDIVTVNILER